MPAYKVKISKVSNMYQIVRDAPNARQAREMAWAEIAPGYTYRWKDKAEFMKGAEVEILKEGE